LSGYVPESSIHASSVAFLEPPPLYNHFNNAKILVVVALFSFKSMLPECTPLLASTRSTPIASCISTFRPLPISAAISLSRCLPLSSKGIRV
jgi:hypothetical protein